MRIASEANGEQFSLAQASRSGWHHARDVRIHSTSADAEERATFARRICAQLAGTSGGADEDTTAAVTGINKRIEMRQIESLTLEGCESLTPDLLDSLLGLVAPTLTVLVSDSIEIVMRSSARLLTDRLRVLAVPALSPKLLAQMRALESLELLGSADETLDVPVSLFIAIRRLSHAHRLRALTLRRLSPSRWHTAALYADHTYDSPEALTWYDLTDVLPAHLTHLAWVTSSTGFIRSDTAQSCIDHLPHLCSIELTQPLSWPEPRADQNGVKWVPPIGLTRCTHAYLRLDASGDRLARRVRSAFQVSAGQLRLLSLDGYEQAAKIAQAYSHGGHLKSAPSLFPFEQTPLLEELRWFFTPVHRPMDSPLPYNQTRLIPRVESNLWPRMLRDIGHCQQLRRIALGPCGAKFKLTQEGASLLAHLPKFERLTLYSDHDACAPMQFSIQGGAMNTITCESATWRTIDVHDSYRSIDESTAGDAAWLKQPEVLLPMSYLCTAAALVGATPAVAPLPPFTSSSSDSLAAADVIGTVANSSPVFLARLARFHVRRQDVRYVVRLDPETGKVNGVPAYHGRWMRLG